MEITRELARFVVKSQLANIPVDTFREARRSVVNWMGCAIGGAHHEAVDLALATLGPFSGPAQAGILGRTERLDILHAALVNGISAHVLDFDDTHLRTLVHPSVPVASSLLALAEYRPFTGSDFLHAFILGVEVECRIANAIYQGHNVNWYITGTAGVFGAAAAVGRVLALDEQKMAWAFGIAGTQAAGLREMAGTMCKSFVHGRAAQNGMQAALLAARGFTSSERVIEAPRGFANAVSTQHDLGEVLAGLGKTWEMDLNTYKPHACGVVCHPVIDACLKLRGSPPVDPARIAGIALRVHPLALKLTGIKSPKGGLESKWSLYHSAAVSIVDGIAGERQYTDELVFDPRVAALRERIIAEPDTQLREDEAHARMTLVSGEILNCYIPHALGSASNPMSDQDLERKFIVLVADALPQLQTRKLIDCCWALAELPDAGELARLAVP